MGLACPLESGSDVFLFSFQASTCTVLYHIGTLSFSPSCLHTEFLLTYGNRSLFCEALPHPPGRVNFSSVPMVISYTFISGTYYNGPQSLSAWARLMMSFSYLCIFITLLFEVQWLLKKHLFNS